MLKQHVARRGFGSSSLLKQIKLSQKGNMRMKIKPFKVEEWMNAHEKGARYNIAETCVDSVSLDELFALTGEDKDQFWKEFSSKRLTYGYIEGNPSFKEGICKLYRTIRLEEVITTHGAAGANHHVFYSMLEPGDRVVSIIPTYQQLYSIPESYGAEVKLLHLKMENNFLPDLKELKVLATPGIKMICINNPNNPTGALMSKEMLLQIAQIARSIDAYVLCDEVYRHLTQEDEWCESIADLYEKGISVGSMSKVFSLAGLRLGWIATHDKDAIRSCLSHRDYNLISCGILDEMLADIALRHSDIILERSRSIVRSNLDILDRWMRKEVRLHYKKPQAGTTALLFYDFDIPSYEFCERMYRETGAFVTPGDCFEEPSSVRIGYAGDTKELIDGLDAMSKFIEKLEKEGY
jgi:aspartate/methionine/tyrosine aminotransferase